MPQQVTDNNGTVHSFPDEATPDMISQALGLSGPSAPSSPQQMSLVRHKEDYPGSQLGHDIGYGVAQGALGAPLGLLNAGISHVTGHPSTIGSGIMNEPVEGPGTLIRMGTDMAINAALTHGIGEVAPELPVGTHPTGIPGFVAGVAKQAPRIAANAGAQALYSYGASGGDPTAAEAGAVGALLGEAPQTVMGGLANTRLPEFLIQGGVKPGGTPAQRARAVADIAHTGVVPRYRDINWAYDAPGNLDSVAARMRQVNGLITEAAQRGARVHIPAILAEVDNLINKFQGVPGSDSYVAELQGLKADTLSKHGTFIMKNVPAGQAPITGANGAPLLDAYGKPLMKPVFKQQPVLVDDTMPIAAAQDLKQRMYQIYEDVYKNDPEKLRQVVTGSQYLMKGLKTEIEKAGASVGVTGIRDTNKEVSRQLNALKYAKAAESREGNREAISPFEMLLAGEGLPTVAIARHLARGSRQAALGVAMRGSLLPGHPILRGAQFTGTILPGLVGNAAGQTLSEGIPAPTSSATTGPRAPLVSR